MKTHKTAVVLIPPEEMWEPIQTIRGRLDRNIRRWMPHITMVYPFRPPGEFAELSRRFEEVCGSFAPFRVRLAEFRYFRHSKNSHTIWLDPDPGDTISDLQGTLSEVVPDCDEVASFPKGFTPHLSVGQAGVDVEDVIRELGEGWNPLEFTIDAINLIQRGEPPDDVFRTWGSVPLGKSGHVKS